MTGTARGKEEELMSFSAPPFESKIDPKYLNVVTVFMHSVQLANVNECRNVVVFVESHCRSKFYAAHLSNCFMFSELILHRTIADAADSCNLCCFKCYFLIIL